mgnify:FL=1
MVYLIYDKSGELTNRIESGTQFVDAYCKSMGYTYSAEPVTPAPEPEPEPTETEQLRADVDFLSAMMGVTL